ncbi:hypothetical protein Tco_1563018 [Tanacetum coccineum]
MSSAKAENVALSASYAQVMWMRTHLKDDGFNYNKIQLYYDSQSAIAISCNPVQHSRTKHINVRYHFIKEHVERGTNDEDAHEHVQRVLEIVDLFHFPGVTHDAVMLRIIPIIGMMKHPTKECPLKKEDEAVEQSKYMRSFEETIIKFYEESIKIHAADDEWISKTIENMKSNIRALKTTTKNLQEKAYQLTQTVLTNTREKRTTMGKGNMKEPVLRDLLPTPFLGHLKEQIGSPYRTIETVCMIENPGDVHKMKA